MHKFDKKIKKQIVVYVSLVFGVWILKYRVKPTKILFIYPTTKIQLLNTNNNLYKLN